jgi:arginine decarboxylase
VLKLVNALDEISRSIGVGHNVDQNCQGQQGFDWNRLLPPQIMTPRQAWLAGQKKVLLEESRGFVSGELITVYPPGIAVIYPGEEITPEIIEYLQQVREMGVHIQGAADPTLTSLLVVDV